MNPKSKTLRARGATDILAKVLKSASPQALSSGRRTSLVRGFIVRPKEAVNAPHSKRFAKLEATRQSRQRLECGGFSTALERAKDDLLNGVGFV